MFSIIVPTRRDVEAIKPLFLVSDKDTEIIIIDTNYNPETKKELNNLEHDYCKVTYAPPMKIEKKLVGHMTETKYKRDLVRCHNTGFAYAEHDWIIKVDDCTSFHPQFFDILRESIELIKKHLGNKFIIRPVKLEEWAGHKQWQKPPYLERFQKRHLHLTRKGIGGGLCITLDQAVFLREGIDLLNGTDERYDIGHGYDDVDLMQRFITADYNVILDQELMTFQVGHWTKADPIDFSRLLYEFTKIEIVNGRYHAYNPYEIKDIREKMLEEKGIYTCNVGIGKIAENIAIGQAVDALEKMLNPNYHHGPYPFDTFFTEDSLTKNKEKIISLKNKHKGEDLFILGNSPDITQEFINKVRDKTTFAANGFLVMKDIWDYEPTYTVVTNQGTFDNHLRNMKPEFKQYEDGSVSELFLTTKKTQFILSDLILKPVVFNLPCLRKEERIKFLKQNIHLRILNRSEFEPPYEITHETPNLEDICFDLMKGTYLVATVITDLMLPLAVWMGFKNIYLKGCSGGAGHFYDTSPRHFWDEKYQKHIYQDLYAVFKKLFDEKGINIYNLDKYTSKDSTKNAESLTAYNPTKQDGYLWDGPVIHHQLGKEPYVIEYRDLEEIL